MCFNERVSDFCAERKTREKLKKLNFFEKGRDFPLSHLSQFSALEAFLEEKKMKATLSIIILIGGPEELDSSSSYCWLFLQEKFVVSARPKRSTKKRVRGCFLLL